jgi:hypothetical protein
MTEQQQQPPANATTHTIVVPSQEAMADLVGALIYERCTFTAQPRNDGVWHLGVNQDGVMVATSMFRTRRPDLVFPPEQRS